MSNVPERDKVDRELLAARELISSSEEALSPRDRAFLSVLAHLTEAVVRQIRDLDDDIFNQSNELGIILNGLKQGEPERKGFLR